MGSRIKFQSVGDRLPLTMRFGLGYIPIKDLTVSVDLSEPLYMKGFQVFPNMGLEYVVLNILAIRGGYNRDNNIWTASTGLGVKYTVKTVTLYVDYAFTVNKIRNNSNTISLKVGM